MGVVLPPPMGGALLVGAGHLISGCGLREVGGFISAGCGRVTGGSPHVWVGALVCVAWTGVLGTGSVLDGACGCCTGECRLQFFHTILFQLCWCQGI